METILQCFFYKTNTQGMAPTQAMHCVALEKQATEWRTEGVMFVYIRFESF